jgi:hypothetical protein
MSKGGIDKSHDRFAACCARAASGHVAGPPSKAMNSRRLMRFPRWQHLAFPAGAAALLGAAALGLRPAPTGAPRWRTALRAPC